MKKKRINAMSHVWNLRQQVLIFRNFLMIGTFVCCALSVDASAQQKTTVTVNLKNVSLNEVISELKRQTDYDFFYNTELAKSKKNVNVMAKDKQVTEVLDEILPPLNMEYAIQGDMVTIRAGEQKQVQTTESKKLSGTVIDAEGNALPGVTILVKGTTLGTATDMDGKYNLTLPLTGQDLILVFSFIGMDSKEVTYTGQQTINVTLVASATEIDEVVVTGIFQRKKESYTGSVKTVTSKELKAFGNRNVLTSLRNIDPSFNIVMNNEFGNDPNRLPEIQIRGNSSLPNVDQIDAFRDETRAKMNTPLVIVDGFESTLQYLMDMNDNDIESITLLKDASATSIYGSRGANGVIMVTTRAPEMGQLKVSYRGDITIEVPDLTSYDLLNAREKLELEQRVGMYEASGPDLNYKFQEYYNYLLNEVNRGVDTYWLSAPLRTGVGQRHNIRLDGGDKTFRYSASIQYNETQGVMKESERKNLNGNVQLSYYYKNFKFTNSLQVALNNNQNSPYGSFSDYVKLNPYWRAYDENGNVLKTLGDHKYSSTIWKTGTPGNPLYDAELNTFDKSNSFAVTNNFSVEWEIIPELTARARIGVTKSTNESDYFVPAEHTMFDDYAEEDLLLRGKYDYSTGKGFNYDASLNLSYSQVFKEKHSLFAGLDWNVRQNESRSYTFNAVGFTNEDFNFLPLAMQYAENAKPSGSESLTRAVGITASVNYTYDNRYYVDLSGRLDGASQFGDNKRFAPFWSAGLGWNLHNEKFLKGNDVINHLKLRGSVGITGSQNFDAYQALTTYSYFMDDNYEHWSGAYLMGIGNEDLSWQQEMNYNLGFELQLLDNRFSLEADYYISTTKNLLSSVELPAANGFTSYTENIGKMKNTGVELQATAFVLRDTEKRLSWSISASMMHNKNKIVEISQAMRDAQESIEKSGGSSPTVLYREGYSTNTIWVVPSLGIDPSNGKEVYLNRFGETTYLWDARDLADAGVSEPKFQGNLNSTLRWRDLSVNLSFGYRLGGQLYNQTLIDKVENVDYKYNVDSRVYTDRWSQPGDRAFFKGLDVLSTTQKTSRFVQNERTFDCQNINISYDFRTSAVQKYLGMQVLTLTANVADVFYLSTVKRERGTSYPFSRQFSFTLSATF